MTKLPLPPFDHHWPEPTAALTAHKDWLAALKNDLAAAFNCGIPISELLNAHADVIDVLLQSAWRHFLGDGAAHACLVAVGGYGRRELHPYSDVDVLVLVPATFAEHDGDAAPIGELFRFLWDIGLKPGYSVRNVQDCVQAAADDQTIITNLSESRYLSGNHRLFARLQTHITPEHLWPAQAFFDAKRAEQEARYHKYNDSAYNLEPNVKEGPGGLRDIQLIAWVTRRLYGVDDPAELVSRGILTDAEYAELADARDYLWNVRFALHLAAGRGEDRLLFEHQKTLADRFGFSADRGNEAVEQFMQQYFRTVIGVERLNEMLLQLFQETMTPAPSEHAQLAEGYRNVGGYLEATDPGLFRRRPLALLEIFLVLQKHPELHGVRARTLRAIRANLSRIDDNLRRNPSACAVFLSILRQPSGITHELRRMNRYGVLAAYLPEFARVVGRMQFDLFHAYTVDEHTLFVVRNLRRISLAQHRDELPFAHDLFRQIAKPELLYIAGLFHDIAKGSGGDHSEVGEHIATAFCRRHALGDDDSQLVAWLVRHHLLMSLTAQRKDISDPDVVHEFALTVGSEEYLSYLYLLTVADIRATNSNLWNSWKDALLKELFVATRRALRSGLQAPLAAAEIRQARRHDAQRLLQQLGLGAAEVEALWAHLADEYFLRFKPQEIAWHTIALAGAQAHDLPIVLLRPEGQWGSAEIFIYTYDRAGLFACTTAVLDQLGLTILDARLITTQHGDTLNSYQVLERNNDPVEGLARQSEIVQRLRAALLEGHAPTVRRRAPAHSKHFNMRPQVYLQTDPQARYSVLELFAADRPGLLSKVGQAFTQHGIQILNARISTIGCRAEDVFYLVDSAGQALDDAAAQQALRETLVQLLSED